MHPRGKNVWITGASSGIGRALAAAMAGEGARVVLSARRRDRLEEVAGVCRERGGVAEVLAFDVAESGGLSAAAEAAAARIGPIDMMVHSVGIGQRGLALSTEEAVGRRVFEVDFWGAVGLTRAVVPGMVERGLGQVVVVSSLLGKFGAPRRAYYSAAKHALQGWFDSLREELLGSGVGVTVLVPGWVRTEISEHALEADGVAHGTMDAGQARGISAEECAVRMMSAIIRDRPEQLIGGVECGGAYLHRIWPGLFRRLMRKKGIG